MAQFQLPHSTLFPGGTWLLIAGTSSLERLVLQTGKQVTLELTGLASSSDKPVVGQVPLQGVMDLLNFQLGNAPSAGGPDVVLGEDRLQR